jgi:hypothetical protein
MAALEHGIRIEGFEQDEGYSGLHAVQQRDKPGHMCQRNGSGRTSSAENRQCLVVRSILSASVRAVWTTNFGWPLVPDVLINTEGS